MTADPGPGTVKTLHRTCIICPRGCPLTITVRSAPGGRSAAGESDGTGSGEAGIVIDVAGNACPKGEDYGMEEATNPRRILTTTVRTTVAARPRLPVRGSHPVPLGDIMQLMRAIDGVVVRGPVRCGDAVALDVAGLGVDLIATDNLGR